MSTDTPGSEAFLTPAELRELTGYAHRSRQLGVLQGWGIDPLVPPSGHIKVTWEVVHETLRRRSRTRRAGRH